MPLPVEPFFIIGCPRSGTTMLRLMLNMHSRLRVPEESWFLRSLFGRVPPTGRLTEEHLQIAYEAIRSDKAWINYWRAPDEALRAALFQDRPDDLASLIDCTYRRCCDMQGKPRWGDKTPMYSLHVPEIATIFPRAKFIHVIRDVRDVYISVRNAGWYDKNPRRISRLWTGMVSDAIRGRTLGSEYYREVRYEDLVRNPEGTLREICEFLGEEFEPAMLEFHTSAKSEIMEWLHAQHLKTMRPPRISDVARWQTEASPVEIAVVENYCAAEMEQVGQRRVSEWPARCAAVAVRAREDVRCFLGVWAGRIRNRLVPAGTGEAF